jgi:uncharacterized protein YaiL (DUF2058 family)
MIINDNLMIFYTEFIKKIYKLDITNVILNEEDNAESQDEDYVKI